MLRQQTQAIRKFILQNIDNHPDTISGMVSANFNISRQAVNRHIQSMVADKILKAKGHTRQKTYAPVLLEMAAEQVKILPGLEEDIVWSQMIREHLANLPDNVMNICHYGFTEMFNNVLDHSNGTEVFLSTSRTTSTITLHIHDNGIGIFHKLQQSLGYSDPRKVVLELAKGKLTTDPDRHTGEGIFFTSRAFDRFSIRSGNLYWQLRDAANSYVLDEVAGIHVGTTIDMSVCVISDRVLKEVFERFAGLNFGFNRTHIPVSLMRLGDENLVSRSQAKRLVTRFEKFDEIILDFTGVAVIGQAFADEVFRVFQKSHPEVTLKPVNVEPEVRKMIDRAKNTTT